jgi:hypothetical protein
MARKNKNPDQVSALINGLDFVMPTFEWRQIGGDMDPGAHGGIIATADGNKIELIEIQPVREFVGDDEAADVGFPFWTREATYDMDDIRKHAKEVIKSTGADEYLLDLEPKARTEALAEAMLSHGVNVEEGNSGWTEDIVTWPVTWWSGKVATFEEYAGDEDGEFRREVLEEEEDQADNPSDDASSRAKRMMNPQNY